MTNRPALSQPPIPDVTWEDYDDVSALAALTGIKYPVFLDHRIRTVLERDINLIEFEGLHGDPPLAIYVLVPLQFLLDRFPSMTRFRYAARPGRKAESKNVPVFATFHHDERRGYFVALSLDIHQMSLNE